MRRQIPVVLSTVPRITGADGGLTVPDSAESRSNRLTPEAVSPRAWRALFLTSLATVLVGFNSTATNIALDDIREGFTGATTADVGWGVAGFFIGTAAFLPLAGRLADRIGRKRIFQLGLLLFALSAVLSAVAPTVLALNLSRVLQAVAGAALLPSSLSLVLPLFPESLNCRRFVVSSRTSRSWGGASRRCAHPFLRRLANRVSHKRADSAPHVLGRTANVEGAADARRSTTPRPGRRCGRDGSGSSSGNSHHARPRMGLLLTHHNHSGCRGGCGFGAVY